MTYENDRAFPKNTYKILAAPAIKSRQLEEILYHMWHASYTCFLFAFTGLLHNS